jgi:hypothetical protein
MQRKGENGKQSQIRQTISDHVLFTHKNLFIRSSFFSHVVIENTPFDGGYPSFQHVEFQQGNSAN